MKKSIFLFFAAILCAIGMNAATVTSDGTARLYFNLKAVSWWNAGTNGNGNFAYFFNNSTGKNAWSAHAVKHSGDTYYVVIPNGTWAGVILTRNNTSTAPSWNNKWNQTGDITLSNTSNYISKFSEGSTSVTWGTAVKPASNAAVSAVASTIFVGASTILTPSLTSNADINDIKSTTYTISPNTGAGVSGNTFTATAEGTYTITATVTYHPDGYSDTKLQSTATATTTITVEELPTYTVTVNAGEGGTVTEGGIVTEGSSINITATPAENYEFNGWTITTGEGTFDNENAVSTTFSPTSDATIQANFRSTATYALKVIAGANIASAEGNVDPVTLGESYDITATPVVGYTFAGWTAEPTENATFATQESTTQVTVLNGSVNVTATATETMSALTTANSFDQDTPPAEVPTATATEIGIVTTAEVTATDVTGYTFVGWELTNCVSDDELTAKTIAVKSNGDGAAATATAKYEIIKLTYTVIVPEGTEKCYIAGDMNTWTFTEMENQGNNVFTLTIIGATKEHGYKYACGNEWKYVEKTADGNEVSNRSYTANDKVLAWNDPLATNLYLRGTMNGWGTTDRFKKETEEATTAIVIVKLDANTTFDFKVANADWSEGYSSTEQFTATATQTLKTSVSSNAQLKTSIEGNYTFTWNVKTKELTITYPELPKYQVTTTANPAAAGTVEGAGEYEQGKTATLTATANDHYVFVNWTKGEEVVAKTAEYTFTVEEDVELKANFARDTHTVNANATNGTVTGAGTYNHGATVTLTATPDFDYEFVKWSNESTENPLTITVTDNETLEAIFAEVAATTVTESGKFSISAHKTATFATGNLQYNVGTETWRFAKQQYQVVGEQNIQLGHPDFTGWIDMLGYSADGKYGVNPSNKNEDYAGEFVDWGTLFPEEGWSTLSKEDWKYLLEERTNAATLQQVAKVGDILGIMLFPDNWTLPEDCNPTPEINHDPDDGEETKYDFTTQNYTLEQWTKLEQAGAVFLPAAGRRTGGWGNITLSENVPGGELDAEGHYKHFDNCNEYAYYWTSTKVGENVNYLINCRLVDKPNNIYSVGAAHVDWAEKGRYGQSVRLAKVVYDKHTVTATAVNGTVTGLVEGGIYEHGATATLTATPAFDYQFVNWSNGSTDNPLTITVTDNETLEAIFAEVAATKKTESGVFSISAHKTATFATGNLQYNVGTETWRFAKQQYQVVGEQNIQLGHPDFTGWIDMLGYSADGKYGVNPSNANADYAEEFVDWGTLFPEEGWSTLSKEDWKYLLEKRTNAATLQQVAKVGGILGIMLFPDNWTLPEDCNPTPEINHDPDDGEETKYDFTTQNYTLEQWTKLEQAGAVFLPAAGRRTGGWGNTTLSENVPGGVLDADGHYKHFDNCNEYAYYWTSTKVGENVNYLINCRLVDKPNDIYSVGAAHVDWAEEGRYGQSVRLAKVVYDKHTVTATAENGTVTGADADEYTHGTEITLTAIPAEHYVFVNWTAGETVLSTENPYIFTLEKDVEITANFALDSHTVTATSTNGTVTGLVEGGKYEHGATATLTATADEGYEFVNWTAGKDTVSTEATYTFPVEADVNLVANFKKQIVHTAITAEDAIVRLIDGVLYFNGVLEDGTPYQVTLNEYTEVGDYTNMSWTTYGEDKVEVVGAQANVTDEEGKLILTATVTNETNSYGLTISGILPAAEEDVKEVESLVYTLTPASGSNNGYANNCDITIDGITWNLTGNSTMQPWRIGGKSITKVDRALYSKTPLAYNISKIEVTHGTANNITVNSFKLIISDEVNGAGETIDVDFKASATTTIDLPEGDYTNKYFKFLYNVTVGSDNKYIQFTGAKFYATITTEANPAPEAPAFTGEANFVGSTEVELTTTEENINIYYTLTDDYTLPTAGYMYAEPVELTETTTVKAIAHNTQTGKISEIAEKTFTKAELYTIKWSVNGEVSETTEVVQGNTLTLPADPTAPEACGSKVFMGWATTSSVDPNGTDITYVDNTTSPTGDAIYYAVFAKTSISDSSEDKEVTLSIKEYAAANGWVNGTKYTSVVVDENVTATVSNGSNTGKYYTNGNEWRIYQSENATLTIAAKEGCMLKAINVIYNVGNTGTLLDAPSGKEVEVEAESVTFKVGNTKSATNGQVKITAMTITYNAGEAYTYSEYSTTCSGTGTDVENIEVKGKSVKMIVNGQLIIIKNGVTYNAQGQVVK